MNLRIAFILGHLFYATLGYFRKPVNLSKEGDYTMDKKLKKHGAISWSELITADVTAAKAFYRERFGWTFDEMPVEEGE